MLLVDRGWCLRGKHRRVQRIDVDKIATNSTVSNDPDAKEKERASLGSICKNSSQRSILPLAIRWRIAIGRTHAITTMMGMMLASLKRLVGCIASIVWRQESMPFRRVRGQGGCRGRPRSQAGRTCSHSSCLVDCLPPRYLLLLFPPPIRLVDDASRQQVKINSQSTASKRQIDVFYTSQSVWNQIAGLSRLPRIYLALTTKRPKEERINDGRYVRENLVVNPTQSSKRISSLQSSIKDEEFDRKTERGRC
jgi:hypothetical protein